MQQIAVSSLSTRKTRGSKSAGVEEILEETELSDDKEDDAATIATADVALTTVAAVGIGGGLVEIGDASEGFDDGVGKDDREDDDTATDELTIAVVVLLLWTAACAGVCECAWDGVGTYRNGRRAPVDFELAADEEDARSIDAVRNGCFFSSRLSSSISDSSMSDDEEETGDACTPFGSMSRSSSPSLASEEDESSDVAR